jgi:hypothetical protein
MGVTVRTCALVRNVCISSRKKLKRRDNLAGLDVDHSVLLKWALEAKGVTFGIAVVWLWILLLLLTTAVGLSPSGSG